ncbi:hypothetical protein ACW73L_17220 [Methylolobus aquaticus]
MPSQHTARDGLQVTVDLSQVPIAEALHHLLQDFELVMLYRAGDTRRNVPKSVLIYPGGTGEHRLTAATRNADRARSFAQDRRHPDPERRTRYVERSLAKATKHEARSIIEQALNDPDGSVREKAISGALTQHWHSRSRPYPVGARRPFRPGAFSGTVGPGSRCIVRGNLARGRRSRPE